MKKIIKSLVAVFIIVMALGTTCFAADDGTRYYFDGKSIKEIATEWSNSFEMYKNTKPEGTYLFNAFYSGYTVIIVSYDRSNGPLVTLITSIVYDPDNKISTYTVTSVCGDVNSSESFVNPITTVELK